MLKEALQRTLKASAVSDLAAGDQTRSVLVEAAAARASGRPPFEELHVTRCGSPLLQFGESALTCRILDDVGKLASKWETVAWLGCAKKTNERLVGCPAGAVRCRAVKRRPEDCQWDRQLYTTMVWVPVGG